MTATCHSCHGIIRASNVPHNQAVWFKAKKDYHVYHCDKCNRTWDTRPVFLTSPVRLHIASRRWSWSLKSYVAGQIDHNKKAWYTILRAGPVMIVFGKDMRKWQRVRSEQVA